MPEQKSMMKKFEIEDMKVRKPELDEYELQEINDLLVESLQNEQQIVIKLWLDGFIEELNPVLIKKIDPYQRKVYCSYKDGMHSFSFDGLIGASSI